MPPSPQDTWTQDAIARNDLDAIRQRVVDDPAYLASRDYLDNTPLLTAIGCGNLEIVEFLLAKGADPNVKVDDGYTCLLLATESDAPDAVAIVAALLAAGANVNATGINGWTPLHMAAAHGYREKAGLLLQAGASVNQRTEIDNEETPLMVAAAQGRPETIEVLLAHGADPSLRESVHSHTPLELARQAAAGPDENVYRTLKEMQLAVDVEQMFADVDIPADLQSWLQQVLANQDLAENYLQNSRQLAETGKHAEVIRLLKEYTNTHPS